MCSILHQGAKIKVFLNSMLIAFMFWDKSSVFEELSTWIVNVIKSWKKCESTHPALKNMIQSDRKPDRNNNFLTLPACF